MGLQAQYSISCNNRQILPRDPEGIFGPTHLICLTDKQRKCRKIEKLNLSQDLSIKLLNQQRISQRTIPLFTVCGKGQRNILWPSVVFPKVSRGLFSALGPASLLLNSSAIEAEAQML